MNLPLPRRERGFSLVELLIAMGLSLVLLAGALSILYSSKVTHSENDRIARLQENGRTVVELILRDARASGFQGCMRPQDADGLVNVLNGSDKLLWNLAQPVYGMEAASGSWSPARDATTIPDATVGSDILVLRTTRQGMPSFRLNAPLLNETSPLTVDTPAGATLEAGSTMVVSDCRAASIFRVTAFTPGAGNTATIDHGSGTADGENASTSLDVGSFLLAATVSPLDTVIYYVAPSTTGLGPALWRRIGAADPTPIVEGVENLQVLYGEDTDGNLLVDQYVKADAVTDWDKVIALTLSVLVRTETETNLDRDQRTYDLLGTSFGPFNDRRQRAVFTTTVVLRNRTT